MANFLHAKFDNFPLEMSIRWIGFGGNGRIEGLAFPSQFDRLTIGRFDLVGCDMTGVSTSWTSFFYFVVYISHSCFYPLCSLLLFFFPLSSQQYFCLLFVLPPSHLIATARRRSTIKIRTPSTWDTILHPIKLTRRLASIACSTSLPVH